MQSTQGMTPQGWGLMPQSTAVVPEQMFPQGVLQPQVVEFPQNGTYTGEVSPEISGKEHEFMNQKAFKKSADNNQSTPVKHKNIIKSPYFPKESYIREVKNGCAYVYSKDEVLVAKGGYKKQFNGLCTYYDEKGNKSKEYLFVKSKPHGWYCIYENSSKQMGIMDKGRSVSLLNPSSKYPSYLEEVVNTNIVSYCKFNENHQRQGLSYSCSNGVVESISLFDNGKHIRVLAKFENNMMTEYDKNNAVQYYGEFNGNVEEGYHRHGLGTEYFTKTQYVYGQYDNNVLSKRIREVNDKSCREYNENGKLAYRGGYVNGAKFGAGYSFSYEKDQLKEVFFCEGKTVVRKMFEFTDGKMSVFTDDGKVYYNGDFKGDIETGFLIEGRGKEFNLAGLLVYDGDWIKGVKEGMGSYYREDGSLKYQGAWKSNKPNGNGTFYQNNKVVYEGCWNNGFLIIEKRLGFDYETENNVKLYDNNRRMYSGNMKNHLPEGQGTFYTEDGKELYSGMWTAGCYPVGKGCWYNYADENYNLRDENGVVFFEGYWSNGVISGFGKILDKDRNVLYKGNWKDNCLYVDDKINIVISCKGTYSWRIQNKLSLCIRSNDNIKEILRHLYILTIEDYNSLTGDLVIHGFEILKSVIIAKNSLAALNSLKICDCKELVEIRAEDSDLPENVNHCITHLEISSRNQ